jgi:hypothetical protein
MGLFLQILGALFLAGLLLVVGGALYLRWKLRRAFQGLSDALEQMAADGGGVGPARITLQPASELGWQDTTGIELSCGELRELGFETRGIYEVPELDGTRIAAFSHVGEGMVAAVYEHPAAGRWVDVVTPYPDGTSFTASNARMGTLLARHPGRPAHDDPRLAVADLVELVRRERPRGAGDAWSEAEWPSRFEAAYAMDMEWRSHHIAGVIERPREH